MWRNSSQRIGIALPSNQGSKARAFSSLLALTLTIWLIACGSSGSVTLGSGTTVHIALGGAPPNSACGLTWCRDGAGSFCFDVGAVNTDAKGSFSGDFDLSTSVGKETGNAGVLYIASGKPPDIQFVQGFTIP